MVILSRVVGLSRLDVQQSRAIGYFETVAGPALPTTMDSGKVAEAAAAVPVWLAEITPVLENDPSIEHWAGRCMPFNPAQNQSTAAPHKILPGSV